MKKTLNMLILAFLFNLSLNAMLNTLFDLDSELIKRQVLWTENNRDLVVSPIINEPTAQNALTWFRELHEGIHDQSQRLFYLDKLEYFSKNITGTVFTGRFCFRKLLENLNQIESKDSFSSLMFDITNILYEHLKFRKPEDLEKDIKIKIEYDSKDTPNPDDQNCRPYSFWHIDGTHKDALAGESFLFTISNNPHWATWSSLAEAALVKNYSCKSSYFIYCSSHEQSFTNQEFPLPLNTLICIGNSSKNVRTEIIHRGPFLRKGSEKYFDDSRRLLFHFKFLYPNDEQS